MNRFLLRRLIQADSENLIDALSTRQHLNPHEPISASLALTCQQLDVCPQAVDRAVSRLGVERSSSIGRLRRSELIQLARTIHKYWRQQRSTPVVFEQVNPALAGSVPTERHP